jgi:ribosomal-protein-alanine N-acetyltransferase
VLSTPDIRLAAARDARPIAELSRDTIEHGLAWSWTPARVLGAIRDPATNVVVAQWRDTIAGFGIMQYADDSAHLALLAVHPLQRHRGLGARMVRWLEASARTAGIHRIQLEARADNRSAIAFYRSLQFVLRGEVAAYYQDGIDAVQLEKKLI